MAANIFCSSEDIQKFLVDNGGKISNQALVKHFKKFLTGPNSPPDAREVFKGLVNSVATVKVEDGVKFVILKKRGHEAKLEGGSLSMENNEGSNTEVKKAKLSNLREPGRDSILHSQSSPSIFSPASAHSLKLDSPTHTSSPVLFSSDLPPGHIPQAPPRRKHSIKGKENRGAKFEESLRQIYEKESTASPRTDDIRDVVSPGNVKEKANRLNEMAYTSTEVVRRPPTHASARRRELRQYKNGEDDACSITSTDPRRKQWILRAAHCDYHELTRLLREEPRLAYVKDFNKYTALHWAAKHGNLDVVKLMAGTHDLDPNERTSGGYTALHLAALFGREEIMEVLINTYGADPSLRDNSGKRAHQHLPKNQVERFLTLFPHLSYPVLVFGKVVVGKNEKKEVGLMRMGSLNSKTKKAGVFSASGRAITRMKSWGSADNIPDRDLNLMPPPKTFPKKKKSRKHADIMGISENWRGRSPDSDSDSASGIAA